MTPSSARPIVQTHRLNMTLLFAALATACAPTEGLDELVTVEAKLSLENGLLPNGLSSNGLNSNGLNSNGLQKLATSSAFNAWIGCPSSASFAENLKLMKYVVSCAVGASTTVTVRDACGGSYALKGALGLAPNWASSSPSVDDRRRVSACLMARTNRLGNSVVISIRGLGVPVSSSEASQFTVREGSYYGDVFVSSIVGQRHTCSGDAWRANGRDCANNPGGCAFNSAAVCAATCTSSGGLPTSCATYTDPSTRYPPVTVFIQPGADLKVYGTPSTTSATSSSSSSG